MGHHTSSGSERLPVRPALTTARTCARRAHRIDASAAARGRVHPRAMTGWVRPIELCRMSPALVRRIAEGRDLGGVALFAIATLLAGTACYGLAFGLWRDPTQALFSAVKLPLLFVATVLASIVLNVLLAALCRAPLTFRQSAVCVLVGLATTAVVLAAIAPVAAFVSFTVAPPDPALVGHDGGEPAVIEANRHAQALLLFHVGAIAIAGVMGNLRLFALLRKLTGRRDIAARVLVSWLAAELFVGSELSWLLRPFLGRPQFAVSFFTEDPLAGSFYEEVAAAIVHALGPAGVAARAVALASVVLAAWVAGRRDGLLVDVVREAGGLRITSDDAAWRVDWSGLARVGQRRATAWLVDVWEVVLDLTEGRRLLVRFEEPEGADALVLEIERARVEAIREGPFR